jgi:hypothetical protein
MAAFVRFVFTILIVGSAVNLAIVLLANSQSQRNQDRAYRENADRFTKVVGQIDGRLRRADIVVESQRVDARNHVLESTLLIRQYHAAGSGQNEPLPVVRIVIPEDQLKATGLLLDFVPERRRQAEGMPAESDAAFARAYPMLNEAQIMLFDLFCGAKETAPAAGSGVSDARFTYLDRTRVPELVRLDPRAPQASLYEVKLWQGIWNQVLELPRGAALPWVSKKGNLMATWTKPAVITVRRDHTYTAYMTAEGITLNEDEPGISDLMGIMLEEGRRLSLAAPQ